MRVVMGWLPQVLEMSIYTNSVYVRMYVGVCTMLFLCACAFGIVHVSSIVLSFFLYINLEAIKNLKNGVSWTAIISPAMSNSNNVCIHNYRHSISSVMQLMIIFESPWFEDVRQCTNGGFISLRGAIKQFMQSIMTSQSLPLLSVYFKPVDQQKMITCYIIAAIILNTLAYCNKGTIMQAVWERDHIIIQL